MANDLVQPLNGAAPAPATVEPTEAAANAQETPQETPGAASLPEDLLRIPAFQGLIAGQPPAVSADLKTFAAMPEAKVIEKNIPALEKAGIGRYRSLGGDLGVLFNLFYLSSDELKAADSAGKLAELAPPFEVVNQQIASSGAEHPALKHDGKVPEQFRQAPVATPPQALAGSALSPSAQKALTSARAANLSPGQPTEGAKPVQGRILNNILKPTI